MQAEHIWIDKDSKKVNFEAIRNQPDIAGIRHPYGLTVEQLNALGYQEITIHEKPDDYSEDLYYRTEQDEAPYVVYPRKSDEQIERHNDNKARDAAQKHLDDTEYLFNIDRHAELIASEPEREVELRASRAAARQIIRDYNAKYPVTQP